MIYSFDPAQALSPAEETIRMPMIDILYHIPHRLTPHQCAKFEHILRHHRGVLSARFCPHNRHAINIEYDQERTDAKTLLAYLHSMDEQTARFS